MESAIYIVATPIGNLSDITIRAIEILKSVDLVAAEDTRHTRKLLDHYDIRTKMVSLHDHNEQQKSQGIVERVLGGGSLALVSDAGTPLISDPGHSLVNEAKKQGVKVVPIPGPSAIIAALCAAGIPCGKFIFEGFLPSKKKAKTDVLMSYSVERKSVVFYESPHRVLDTLECMQEVFGDRDIAVAREITKRFETIKRGPIPELLEWMSQDNNQQKGEFVLVLAGMTSVEESSSDLEKKVMLARLLTDLPPKKASAIVSDLLGGSKKEIYNLALSLK